MDSPNVGRTAAIYDALRELECGEFLNDLKKLVSVRTVSTLENMYPALENYVDEVLPGLLEPIGFKTRSFENPVSGGGPLLFAERIEEPDALTVLFYGHGDVVLGMDERWETPAGPWDIHIEGDKWYGRGTADNKGQHLVALSAIRSVIRRRGSLGFNIKLLVETSEEIGSPGLREFCMENKDLLQADVLLGSDGPRLDKDHPTLFMGSRGILTFDLVVRCRERLKHSGNWGGLLKDPVIRLSNAISTIADENGRMLVHDWKADSLTASVKEALANDAIVRVFESAEIDAEWGESELSPAERVFASNSFMVLGISSGSTTNPVNAIQTQASAVCQLRFVVGTDPQKALTQLREHLDKCGFNDVEIIPRDETYHSATRLSPDHPWVKFVTGSIVDTLNVEPILLPNLGGSLPNDSFSEILGLPTIWIPHSYPDCQQHSPDEHILETIVNQGLQIMTGLFWDIGAKSYVELRHMGGSNAKC
ncbi:MAG: M20/M25/M40 family metallo-hydrolase [Roseibium sp.]|uniref:M20/M25/M40 family metallo-hydrolase n=1 Tax=Roseibium sp. TaxID=1936156 RepID=UPI00261098C5|nr:M20/M25/M40 family metallo-hydrolase [Roseibium sp.]MCV0429702.1 M20/M25/M40 family metallo-hydrolase [Roseibium sp.]